MGHSLNRTSFRINQNLIIDDVTFEPDYILISDTNGNVSWKNPSTYITQEEPLDRFIGELYGGGVVVAVWREQREQLYEKTLIASVKDFGVWSIGGRGEDFAFTDFTWSWSAVTNTLIGATAQYHAFGASNSLSIVSQDPSGTGAAAKCLGYLNEDLHGLGVYGDWYLPSTFEINCLANNSAIVNRVIAKYAADKSIRLVDETVAFEIYPGGPSYIEWFGASMSLFLNTSPGYWTSTEFNRGSAYYLNMGQGGVIFATASKSNALLNVRPFRQDVKRWNGIAWVQDRKRTGQILIVSDTGVINAEQIRANITAAETSQGNTVTILTTYASIPSDLSIYDHIWDIDCRAVFTSANGAKYTQYLKQGGALFLLGENTGFAPTRDIDIANFITGLGGGTVTFDPQYPLDYTECEVASEFLIANNQNIVIFDAVGRFSSIGTGTSMTKQISLYLYTNMYNIYPNQTTTGQSIVWKTGSLSQAPKGAIAVVLDVNTISYSQGGPYGDKTWNGIEFLTNLSQVLNKS